MVIRCGHVGYNLNLSSVAIASQSSVSLHVHGIDPRKLRSRLEIVFGCQKMKLAGDA